MKCITATSDIESRKIVQASLSHHSRLTLVNDCEQVLTAVYRACKQRDPFQLICLDLDLPGMEDHEILRRLQDIQQEEGKTRQDRAKVILTGPFDHPSYIAAAFLIGGCDGFLAKPLRLTEFSGKLVDLGLLDKKHLLQITESNHQHAVQDSHIAEGSAVLVGN